MVLIFPLFSSRHLEKWLTGSRDIENDFTNQLFDPENPPLDTKIDFLGRIVFEIQNFDAILENGRHL